MPADRSSAPPPDPRAVLTRPAPPPDRTLRYGEHPDQVIDFRDPAPTSGADRPLVAVIHGGFWRAAYDRAHTGPLAADLAAQGYPVAQLEYRRTGQPGGGWPGTFEDVAAGLSAIHHLAADPLLLGHSAGGHLALWWAGRPEARCRGVVALAPVADLTEAYHRDLDGGAVAALLGGGPEEVPDRYADATPAPPRMPVTVVHGDADRQVPVDLSRRWAAAGLAELVELPGVEHFGLIDPDSAAWPAVLAVVARRAGVH